MWLVCSLFGSVGINSDSLPTKFQHFADVFKKWNEDCLSECQPYNFTINLQDVAHSTFCYEHNCKHSCGLICKKHTQGPRVWAYIRRPTTFMKGIFFLWCSKIENLIVWQISSFIHMCLLLLQTQCTIHLRTQWYRIPTRDLDPSVTFARGWSGGLVPVLLYFSSLILLNVN